MSGFHKGVNDYTNRMNRHIQAQSDDFQRRVTHHGDTLGRYVSDLNQEAKDYAAQKAADVASHVVNHPWMHKLKEEGEKVLELAGEMSVYEMLRNPSAAMRAIFVLGSAMVPEAWLIEEGPLIDRLAQASEAMIKAGVTDDYADGVSKKLMESTSHMLTRRDFARNYLRGEDTPFPRMFGRDYEIGGNWSRLTGHADDVYKSRFNEYMDKFESLYNERRGIESRFNPASVSSEGMWKDSAATVTQLPGGASKDRYIPVERPRRRFNFRRKVKRQTRLPGIKRRVPFVRRGGWDDERYLPDERYRKYDVNEIDTPITDSVMNELRNWRYDYRDDDVAPSAVGNGWYRPE